MLAQQSRDTVRRRAFRVEHGGRTDRERKRHRVAETIGEKQFRHRIADITLLQSGNWRAIEIGCEFEARMHMHRALRLAGRARRIEPERNIVAGRRRRVGLGFIRADKILEQTVPARIVTGDDDMFEIRTVIDELFKPREKRLRHDEAFCPAVGQHEAVVIFGQQRVNRHRDDAGLQTTEKRRRPVDRIQQRQQYTLFALDAEPAQRRAETCDTVGELGVGVRAASVDVGRLVGAASVQIGLKDVVGEVVVTWDCAHRRGRDARRFGDCHLYFLPGLCVLCRRCR